MNEDTVIAISFWVMVALTCAGVVYGTSYLLPEPCSHGTLTGYYNECVNQDQAENRTVQTLKDLNGTADANRLSVLTDLRLQTIEALASHKDRYYCWSVNLNTICSLKGENQ